jgi:hypothetical protein
VEEASSAGAAHAGPSGSRAYGPGSWATASGGGGGVVTGGGSGGGGGGVVSHVMLHSSGAIRRKMVSRASKYMSPLRSVPNANTRSPQDSQILPSGYSLCIGTAPSYPKGLGRGIHCEERKKQSEQHKIRSHENE